MKNKNRLIIIIICAALVVSVLFWYGTGKGSKDTPGGKAGTVTENTGSSDETTAETDKGSADQKGNDRTDAQTGKSGPAADDKNSAEGSADGSGAQILESGGDVTITVDDELVLDGE